MWLLIFYQIFGGFSTPILFSIRFFLSNSRYLRSAPWIWKIYIILILFTLRIEWIKNVKKIWSFCAGWSINYGKMQAIGIKPPRLIKVANQNLGKVIYVKEENEESKILNYCCHELTHTYVAYLKLPQWFNEGLAMVMVDKLLNKSTVREDTLTIVEQSQNKEIPTKNLSEDDWILLYARGYWRTRFIIESQPDLLKSILSKRYEKQEFEKLIAAAYEKENSDFGKEIDQMLLLYFKQK